mgnify:CR=1 FL=1
MPSLRGYEDVDLFCMPLGMPYINGALKKAGYNVHCINMQYVKGSLYEELSSAIHKYNIDAVLCGGLTIEYKTIKKVFEACRKAKPDIITVGGGGGFSSEPIIFSELLEVDFAVIGEGEMTSCELADALNSHKDFTKIKGLVYKTENGYKMTEARSVLENPDELPFPDYDGFSIEEYLDHQKVEGWYHFYTYYSDKPRMIPMILARSCPYQCSFCYHPLGKKYRYRSMDNFFEELEMWIEKYKINGIALIDECFSIDAARVIDFCERIKKYNIVWACQMRAETYSEEILIRMKDANCIGAYFGIESLSDDVLKNMNKKISTEQIEKAFEMTYKYQIGCSGSLIFGAENETFDTVKESLKWCDEHKNKFKSTPIRQYGYIDTYPGSSYYENAIKRKQIIDKKKYIKDCNFTLNITSLSEREFEIIGMVAKLRQSEISTLGEVISVLHRESEGMIDVTAKCCHCNGINHYKNLSDTILKKGYIRKLGCRKCNTLCDYTIDKVVNLPEKFVTIQWLLNDFVPDYNLFFYKYPYKKVIVFGKNICSVLLYENLCKISWLKTRKVRSLKDLKGANNECIVVTDPINYRVELKEIRTVTDLDVYCIEDVLKLSGYGV